MRIPSYMYVLFQVLDMCAAPGSKTAQLIEFLHADDTGTNTIPCKRESPIYVNV